MVKILSFHQEEDEAIFVLWYMIYVVSIVDFLNQFLMFASLKTIKYEHIYCYLNFLCYCM